MAGKAYKRGWSHTKGRGRETTVTCGFCGKQVPKYKCIPVFKSFRINDPLVRKELGNKGMGFASNKMYACPACARHRKITKKKARPMSR